jgi:sodium/potassium-transporting ATPase subunit alpha
MKENKSEARPAVIKFSNVSSSRGKAPAESVEQMRHRLRRTDSTVSQAIIAYRTLSITVSENQTKGVKRTKKNAKDMVEGKHYNKFPISLRLLFRY